MNHAMKLDGEWTGTIIFGKLYGAWQNRILHFDMTITQTREEFKGKAIDTDGLGVHPDPATIEGNFDGNVITFVKQYPSFHYFEDGVTKIDPRSKPPKVIYQGVYLEAMGIFVGEWKFKPSWLWWGFIPYPARGSGTWAMRRKPVYDLEERAGNNRFEKHG